MIKLTDELQPIIMLALFLILKAFSRRGFVELSSDLAKFQTAIENLKSPKAERDHRSARRIPWRRKSSAQTGVP